MKQTPAIPEAAVRRLARSQSYDRGEDYYDQGAVIDIVRRGETLRAEVEGSQCEPYHVRIELDDTGVVDAGCSCPYDHGGICKHRVAVLLTYIRDADDISQRPLVSKLIADADPEQLRELLVALVESRPQLAEWVETRLEATETEDIADDSRERTPAINRESIRRQVRYVLQFPKRGGAGVPDPYAAVETDVGELRDLLEQARAAIKAGDGGTALEILEPLADELMDEEWLTLSYDDSGTIFEFFNEVDRALAEALLTADLSERERDNWEIDSGAGNRRREAIRTIHRTASPSRQSSEAGTSNRYSRRCKEITAMRTSGRATHPGTPRTSSGLVSMFSNARTASRST